jgi:hypothetical protein
VNGDADHAHGITAPLRTSSTTPSPSGTPAAPSSPNPVPQPRRRRPLRRVTVNPRWAFSLRSSQPVRFRSNAPDQFTYSNRYEQIWTTQPTLDPTVHRRDPNEEVPANRNRTRGLPVFE